MSAYQTGMGVAIWCGCSGPAGGGGGSRCAAHIHGVVVVGAIIVMGTASPDNYVALVLGFLAGIVGTLNVVGGFVVTDRMLDMFKKKPGKED